MSEATAPALRLHDVVVRAVIGGDAPATPHAPRDLPDLARFLFDALGARNERELQVLDGLSFQVPIGGAMAIVGENGSGKSMLARLCARLVTPERGVVEVAGVDAHQRRRTLAVRRGLQVIFDDEESGLDPRRTIAESLGEAATALRLDDLDDRVRRALELCRLDAAILDAAAGALDDGRRRLAALARALLAQPDVIVIDEPAGHLDPSSRALVLEVLGDLNGTSALLLLTRDLAAARAIASTTGVLHRGALVEIGDTARVLGAPSHPYAQALVAAAPRVAY